jgi:soluble lytic murein transglycosylase-like protein
MEPAGLSQVISRIDAIRRRFGLSDSMGALAAPDRAVPARSAAAGKSAQGAFRFEDALQEASKSAGVDPALVRAVVDAESGGNPEAISPAGAQGLMQLMPETAHDLGVRDPFDPAENMRGGARYLRGMIDRFGNLPEAIAAYNAGPGAVTRHGGIPPYAETKAYVRKVMSSYQEHQGGGR